jgi:hypothetical protein
MARGRVPEASGRIEVESKSECFTVRFYIRNEGDAELEVVYGHSGEGKVVVPTFTVGAATVTPPTDRYLARRDHKPDSLVVPPHQEILYDTYTMGHPPRGPIKGESQVIRAHIEFDEWGPRPPGPRRPLRLQASPLPFQHEQATKDRG